MILMIVGLLEDIFSDLGRRIGGPGRGRHAKILLPKFGPFNHVERLWLALSFLRPIFDPNIGDNRITPGAVETEIGLEIDSLGGALRGFEHELTPDWNFGEARNDCPF